MTPTTPEPVAWLVQDELTDLRSCNGRSIWAESPSIWFDEKPDHLVPVFTRSPEVEALTKERDELRLQIDIQAGSIEPVQSANQRLAKERDALQSRVNQQAAMVEKSIEEMNRNADIGAQAGKERDALAAAAKLALLQMSRNQYLVRSGAPSISAERFNAAIDALRQAGVQ